MVVEGRLLCSISPPHGASWRCHGAGRTGLFRTTQHSAPLRLPRLGLYPPRTPRRATPSYWQARADTRRYSRTLTGIRRYSWAPGRGSPTGSRRPDSTASYAPVHVPAVPTESAPPPPRHPSAGTATKGGPIAEPATRCRGPVAAPEDPADAPANPSNGSPQPLEPGLSRATAPTPQGRRLPPSRSATTQHVGGTSSMAPHMYAHLAVVAEESGANPELSRNGMSWCALSYLYESGRLPTARPVQPIRVPRRPGLAVGPGDAAQCCPMPGVRSGGPALPTRRPASRARESTT